MTQKSGINRLSLILLCWVMLLALHDACGQQVNIDMTSPPANPVILDPFEIGEPYTVFLHPQNPDGDITWEVTSNLSPLSGLKMQVNSTDLISTVTVTPDGSSEDLHFVDNGNPPTINEVGYLFEITLTDDSNEVNLQLRLPVIQTSVSAVFVLDRSGSMGDPPHNGSGTITRLDILQTAASLFINKLDALSNNDDEVALTYFETDVDMPAPGYGANLTPIMGHAEDFTDEIEALTDGGSTNMGGGLLAGKTKLSGAASGNKKFIFLFTDGEQNKNPKVDVDGEVAGADSLNDAEKSIRIVTIGTGAGAELASGMLLQQIAERNTGVDPPTDEPGIYFLLQEEVDPTGAGTDFNTLTGISDFFDQGFEEMLRGSSPQTCFKESGLSRKDSASTYSTVLNAGIDKIIFELVTFDQEPVLTIEKDGTAVTQSNASLRFIYGPNNGTNSLLGILDLTASPLFTSKGTWTVKVGSGTGGGKWHQVKIQADDHHLDYNFKVTSDDFKVGDNLNFQSRLSYDGVPVEDATYSAIVLKPGTDLGDLLAKANVDFTPSDDPDAGSVGYQKLLALLASDPSIADSLGLKENTVNLTHDGDGLYTGAFGDAGVSGTYQVIARISGTGAFGNYERLVQRSVYVRFGDPDPEASSQEHVQLNDTTIRIDYIPKYLAESALRFVGPGFANMFTVKGSMSIDNVVDHGDGSYSITLVGQTGGDIQLGLGGVSVYEGPARGTGSGFCKWVRDVLGIPCWVVVVIVIIIIVIIIIIWRKK